MIQMTSILVEIDDDQVEAIIEDDRHYHIKSNILNSLKCSIFGFPLN